jgi:c-di-GMP-binding flagellar brake protein YcgR
MNPPHHHAGELLRPEDFSRYLLHSRSEILFVLRALQASKALISMHFDAGRGLLPTAILGVDDQAVILDASRDADLNHRAAAAAGVTCAAMQDKIRIQFSLTGLREVTQGGQPAFAAEPPASLLRLQRRENFRLGLSMVQPIKCQFPAGSGPHHYVEATVVDISGGGLAVLAPPEGLRIEPGMEFPNCRVDLPGVGTVVTELRVRSVYETTLRNGNTAMRAGCEFVDLPGSMLNLIQRYIIRVERERKARESGLM